MAKAPTDRNHLRALTLIAAILACSNSGGESDGTTNDGSGGDGDATTGADGGGTDTGGTDGGTGSTPGDSSDDGGTGDDGAPWTGEPDCESLADLSDIAASFSPDAFMDAALAVAPRRYPPGEAFLAQDGADFWFMSPATFDDMIDRWPTAVHEECHGWTWDNSDMSNVRFRMREDLVLTALRLENFPRSEIVTVHEWAELDTRLPTYLEGDSGNQGFDSVLNEINAYVHSIACVYCLRDYFTGGGGNADWRDGPLTFMYYVEKYLFLARTNHPEDYEEILTDPGHIDAILKTWDRAEYWLALTDPYPELGMNDDLIESYVYAPANYEEIERIRDAS